MTLDVCAPLRGSCEPSLLLDGPVLSLSSFLELGHCALFCASPFSQHSSLASPPPNTLCVLSVAEIRTLWLKVHQIMAWVAKWVSCCLTRDSRAG